MKDPQIIIIGASARAGSFSAARAGLHPWWIDQYGDTDLRAAFPGMRLPADGYPDALPALLKAAPPGPVMYTGAVENHLRILRDIAGQREILGNDADTCGRLRDPFALRESFRRQQLDCPEVFSHDARSPGTDSWLVKPLRGAGGQGIHWYVPGAPVPPDCYVQQFIEGESYSAVFAGDGTRAVLLGVTCQLVGREEFHAAEFAYCGSIGPVEVAEAELVQWRRIGSALAADYGLRGLFGVDAVCTQGSVYPVEINPRYTASVEVIERARDVALVSCHLQGCRGAPTECPEGSATGPAGKCYLFAPRNLRAPAPDRIREVLGDIGEVEAADLPDAGEPVPGGAPLLTLLARGADEETCDRLLTQSARRICAVLQ